MVWRKCRIKDIHEGSAPGEVRTLGTIVGRYDGDGYAAVTLDDGSDTIRAKFFKDDVKRLEGVKVGDIVDVFGIVKEYQGEKYLMPSMMRQVGPDFEVMRGLELVARGREKGEGPEEGGADEAIKGKIREMLQREDSGDGVRYETINSQLGIDRAKLEASLAELLDDGEVYEPTYGKYKLI